MYKRLNSNQMCEQFSYKEVFLIKRFLIERFYCIYIEYNNIFIFVFKKGKALFTLIKSSRFFTDIRSNEIVEKSLNI